MSYLETVISRKLELDNHLSVAFHTGRKERFELWQNPLVKITRVELAMWKQSSVLPLVINGMEKLCHTGRERRYFSGKGYCWPMYASS